jgi:hypothetical protein
MSLSVYTVHQANFKNGKLHELLILCRDEPEPPMFFYEEIVVPIEHVVECMYAGDLFYAQWEDAALEIELIYKINDEVTIEVAPKGQAETFSTLANLPCEQRIFN